MPSRRSRGIDKDDAFEETMHLLQHQGGINFREYKPATVMRRIERRMQVRHTPDLATYVRLLDNDRGELAVLRREMLIPVTSFFRDPETFDILAETVVKTIVAERGENQPIRVWVAGASTGEEAYSLAILFAEAFDRARRWPNFKLFATDVEQQNVEVRGGRGLLGGDHGGAFPGTARALLLQARQPFRRQERDPPKHRFRQAQSARRSALHADGPGLVPQSPDLFPHSGP